MQARRAVIGAAVALAATTVASVPAGASPHSSPARQASERVALAVTPPITQWRQRVSLAGEVALRRANQKVTVQFDECGMSPRMFRDVAETVTGEDGRWSVSWLFGRGSGAYRAVWGDEVSNPVHVQGRPEVFIRRYHGRRLSVFVTATIPFYKKHVLLQRLTRIGTWETVRRLVLTEQMANNPMFGLPSMSTGSEKFRIPVPKGTLLRAVFPAAAARPCYLGGRSRTLRA